MAHNYSALSTASTPLTTELNSLANNTLSGLSGSGSGAIFDNTTLADLFGNFELAVTFGAAPTAGSSLDLYFTPSLDGTNYADLTGNPPTETTQLVGSFPVGAVTSAQRIAFTGWSIPGAIKGKFALYNNGTGQALAATGNTLTLKTYSIT